MTLSTLLVAVGPDDADRTDALAAAVTEVAAPTNARVVLLHVFDEADFDAVRERLNSTTTTPTEAARRQQTIRDLSAAFTDADVVAEVRGAVGDVSEAIVDVARDFDADRAFVAGRARSPTGKAMFGSTAQSVLLNAPCPVTFVRDD